jgi:hypothetical protein
MWYLHTLAAACAENGRKDEAVSAATEARALAMASRQSALIETAEKRLELYGSGGRYRDTH